MQGRTGFAMRLALAASTVVESAIAFAPASDAEHAEQCRKAAHRVATRSAPQAEPEDEPATASAPAANVSAAPAANAPAASVAAQPAASASPAPATDPQPVITTLVTRNVSNTEQVAQSP